MFSEALLCFGASSTSMDEDDALQNADEVDCLFTGYNEIKKKKNGCS